MQFYNCEQKYSTEFSINVLSCQSFAIIKKNTLRKFYYLKKVKLNFIKINLISNNKKDLFRFLH